MIKTIVLSAVLAIFVSAEVIIIGDTGSTSVLQPKHLSERCSGVRICKNDFFRAIHALNGTAIHSQFEGFRNAVQDSRIDSKREAAMFLAHIWHNSMGLKEKREVVCMKNMSQCIETYKNEKGGKEGRVYYGRGYMQLAWDYNYKEASQALLGDPERLLESPELVAEDDSLSWRVASFYWDKNVHEEQGVKEGKFGATTQKINGPLECKAGDDKANEPAKKRFGYYKTIMEAWNIGEQANEAGCYN